MGVGRGKHILFGMIALVAAVLTSRPAHADWDLQVSTMVAGGWLRNMPSYVADEVDTSARRIRQSDVKARGGLGMIGIGMDTELTIDDRWKVPILGATAWWTLGDYARQVSSDDGSIATLRPWTTSRMDVLLPGIGRRFKYRREMVSFAVRTGVSYTKMDGTVAAGPDTRSLDLMKVTPLLQAEIEGCRRLDPTTRVCLWVAPRIYEYGWFNGIAIGLRMEWGR